MKTQTFEDLIEKEYKFDRKGMCQICTYYCWLHNPFIHCRLLEDNYSPETKPEVTKLGDYHFDHDSALCKTSFYKDKDSGQL